MLDNIVAWWRQRKEKRLAALMFESKIVVKITADGISAHYPDGKIEEIAWDEVERVAIETNDSGPWGADFWWLFEGNGKRCAYPQGATGEVEAMQSLPEFFPGFSHEVLIEANGCTTNKRFVCWERSHAP